ncbi:MAG: glycosyltransferase [Alphaproteobacteria bacterium]|nr:glycosyltransferase [Alphaproteobacteria bacterium]
MPEPAPLFSLITVTLNNRAGLQSTRASVESQVFNNFEWIIIDGGSTDGTQEDLATTNANWTSEQDTGLYDAMNKGLTKAKGTYLLFLNAGDRLAAPTTLEKIAAHTEKQPDFIYGDALETTRSSSPSLQGGGRGRVSDAPLETKPAKPFYKQAGRYKDLPSGMFTHHQAMLYKRSKISETNQHYSLIYPIAADYDFTARFLKKCEKIAYFPHPICIFESGGLSQQNAFDGRREQYLIREKLEMVSQPENVWIFLTQTLKWQLRKTFPFLYRFAKSAKRK